MRRTLLAFVSLTLTATVATAQCSFDQQFAGQGPGMFPAQLDPVETCVGCGGHTRSVSLTTNTYLDVANPLQPGSTIRLYIDATKLLSIEGQPSGTSFGTDLGASPNLGIWYNTGNVPNQTAAQGCAYVAGDEATWNAAVGGGPANDGLYPLTISVDARIHSSSPDVSSFVPNGSWASEVDPGLGGGAIVFDTYVIEVIQGEVVGIHEQADAISIYPNPATDLLRINLGQRTDAVAEMFDMRGVRVFSTRLSATSTALQLHGLTNGLYTCRISDMAGNPLLTERMVVMH